MQARFENKLEEVVNLKRVLRDNGFGQRLMTRLEYEGRVLDENGRNLDFSDKMMPYEPFFVEFPNEPADPHVAISSEPVEILFENENWLAVDKPAGVTSVPGPHNSTDTMVNRIKGLWTMSGAENLVPHLITRLDRDTSGVMLVAKNQLANSLISDQVKSHQMHKHYIAVVSGVMTEDEGKINQPIGRSDDGIHREVREDGQTAKTKFKVIERLNNATVVDVELITGRTHQIRVHFQNLGFPLIGDELYGGSTNSMVEHQALHASSLEFTDPFDGQEIKVESPLPSDLEALINSLKQ
ncbi:RluA family pseudouridine synthase [Pediococcus argentinicus]|uniref:RluA family pseudouridine synthase n=1 Tax=Pediococcus argentinicus TaxID=480391 RepID=UPI00338EAD3F